MPRLVIAPSVLASFVYVFVFSLWTLYISMSNSSMLPTYQFVGLKALLSNCGRTSAGSMAYGNLFFFSVFYVVLALVIGLALAIAIDQRVKGEAVADDLSLSARRFVRGHRLGLELAL